MSACNRCGGIYGLCLCDALPADMLDQVRAGLPDSRETSDPDATEIARLQQVENDYRALAMCIGADPDHPADEVFEVALKLWREMKLLAEQADRPSTVPENTACVAMTHSPLFSGPQRERGESGISRTR